jgi:LmbE family N-acetylglucosaminyl deacetylase
VVIAAGSDAFRSLRLRASPWTSRMRRSRWLVLAPHPDDETLGAGGLIARLAAEGHPAWVVFLTAGEASHVGSPQWPRERLAHTRKREAHRALGALRHPHGRVNHLAWQDGNPPAAISPAFRRSCSFLIGLCRRHHIRNLATTWRGEDHCDHQAAFQLGRQVAFHLRGYVTVFQYLVWGWRDPLLSIQLCGFEAMTVDAAPQASLGRKAIRCHRTQISALVQDAAEAFRLPPDMIALATRNPTILLRERRRDAA